MKKLFLLFAGIVTLSCNEFDDSAIWDELNSQSNRIAKLELLCTQMNTNIESIQVILEASSENDYVTHVAPITQGGKEIGYTVTFNKSGTITIYHGQDGYTPVIGVRKDADGLYYWTLDGAWLLDDKDDKVRAQGLDSKDDVDGSDGEDGKDGTDGITPELKIEGGYWYVSYDNGLSWTRLGKATGEDGKDGADGSNGNDGDSMFKSVEVNHDNQTVTFTLNDGSRFVLPMRSGAAVEFEETSILHVTGKTSVSLKINVEYQALYAEIKDENGNSSLVTKADENEWKVKIDADADPVVLIVTPPSGLVKGSKALLVVMLMDNNGVNHSVSRLMVYDGDNGGNNDDQDEPNPSNHTDLSANGTANCYIVSEAGDYKFSTVQGNSSTSVGNVVKAEVLWETFGTNIAPGIGDLVSDVNYIDGCIFFKASDKKGNVSIAAKDASGKILWSWHIWMTDKPVDQVYNNNAGTMMDRNLGATSATPGDVGALGLLYQWGRKDPFLGSSSLFSDNTKANSTITWPSCVTSNISNGTIAYAIEHPTTFINSNNNNYDWFYTGNSSTDNTRWQLSKTIYDPCPKGYHVPKGGYYGLWRTAFDKSFGYLEDDFSNNGFNFGKNSLYNSLTSEEICWYPASGCLANKNLANILYKVGIDGYYWSYSISTNNACVFYFNGDGKYESYQDSGRGVGKSVRCLKEE